MVTLQPFNIDGFRGRGLALIYCRGAEARRDQGRSQTRRDHEASGAAAERRGGAGAAVPVTVWTVGYYVCVNSH